MGLLTRLALYGEPDIPRDRVLLNLGDELAPTVEQACACTGEE